MFNQLLSAGTFKATKKFYQLGFSDAGVPSIFLSDHITTDSSNFNILLKGPDGITLYTDITYKIEEGDYHVTYKGISSIKNSNGYYNVPIKLHFAGNYIITIRGIGKGDKYITDLITWKASISNKKSTDRLAPYSKDNDRIKPGGLFISSGHKIKTLSSQYRYIHKEQKPGIRFTKVPGYTYSAIYESYDGATINDKTIKSNIKIYETEDNKVSFVFIFPKPDTYKVSIRINGNGISTPATLLRYWIKIDPDFDSWWELIIGYIII